MHMLTSFLPTGSVAVGPNDYMVATPLLMPTGQAWNQQFPHALVVDVPEVGS